MTTRVIDREVLLDKLYGYARNEISLPEIVDWAENVFVDDDIDVEGDIDLLMDVIFCLAGGDTRVFPLTRDALTGYVEKLGGKMPVIIQSD
ncbi:MAG: hypothetical protein OXP68_12595 [Anaerolineaceae bacterium]|nr:hypothetical protein [Anaerolineaceae bacterium]MDE0329039.1 hypothetical protein [Anaerolineaceae bacterium]MDE0609003.1 hypothetical protein [Anaerolineaceae bacterium]